MAYPTAEDVAESAKYFDDAVAYIHGLPKHASGVDPPRPETKLHMYALFKQATQGAMPADAKRPGGMSVDAKFKHDAWKSLGVMDSMTAKAQYVDAVAASILVGHEKRTERKFLEGLLASASPPKFLHAVVEEEGTQQPRFWALAEKFASAVRKASTQQLNKADAAVLQGLYHQALLGDVFIERPGIMGGVLGIMSASTWDAWAAQKGKTKMDAMQQYIDFVDNRVS